MQKAHTQAMVLKALRSSLKQSREEATQRLQHTLAEGGDTARRLRSFIKATYGPRAEMLRRYGIKPLRRRPRPRPEG